MCTKRINRYQIFTAILSFACAFFLFTPLNSLNAQIHERGYVSGKYGIELDGIMAGWIQSVEGGTLVSDVVEEKLGPDNLARKHLAGVKYEDISINCGTGMSKEFYQWIQDSFDKKYSRKSGSIIACDYNYKAKSEIEFINALITEVGFPALDAASKDACKMTVKIKPEMTRYKRGSGENLSNQFADKTDPKVQKKWLPANFRLKIDGLDDACKRVNKIEAIVVKQKIAGQEPGKLEFPNLVFTVPESDGKEFTKWNDDILSRKSENTKTGSLEYLLSDNQESLFELDFTGLIIESVTRVKVGGANFMSVRVKVGRIEFKT